MEGNTWINKYNKLKSRKSENKTNGFWQKKKIARIAKLNSNRKTKK